MITKSALGVAAAVALAALGGCQRSHEAVYRVGDANAGCASAVSAIWATNAATSFHAQAQSKGARCEDAALTLAIVDDTGAVLWRDAERADRLFGFEEVRGVAAMRRALGEWVSPPDDFARADALPAWPEGAAGPQTVNGYPFYPENGVTRAQYEQIRRENRPLFCYVEARDSVYCLTVALQERRVIPLGVQTFPG